MPGSCRVRNVDGSLNPPAVKTAAFDSRSFPRPYPQFRLHLRHVLALLYPLKPFRTLRALVDPCRSSRGPPGSSHAFSDRPVRSQAAPGSSRIQRDRETESENTYIAVAYTHPEIFTLQYWDATAVMLSEFTRDNYVTPCPG